MKSQPQILIVDDEPFILKMIKKLLSKYNLDIFLAVSPMEALNLIKQEQIDLILSDQRMPDMDGLSLLAQVKKLSPSTICILMSGYSDVDLLVTAINSGSIYQYIPKPWENEKFLKTIFKALEVQVEAVEHNRILHKLFTNKKWIDTLSQTRLSRRSDFLNNIIKHQPKISAELETEARIYELPLDRSYHLCLLSVSDDTSIDKEQRTITTSTKSELIFIINMLPNCIAWRYDDFICIIISGEVNEEERIRKKIITDITDIASEFFSDQFTIGISNVHSGLEELKTSYNQAYHAHLSVRGSKSRIAHYEKLGALQLLARLKDSSETEEFIENILGRLIRYDKEKGTNMLQTLEVYLRTSSMKEAAEILYIHIKTMTFRKNRIEKILGFSLEDYETRLSVCIALKLHSLK